jgi:hypothetical protein
MTAPCIMGAREIWQLINSVRGRCYDIFTYDEKYRLHHLIIGAKKGIVSDFDIAWLKQCDENLRAMGIRPPTSTRRPRWKARRAHG